MVAQTEAQVLGREGERWFQSQVPAEWAYEPPRIDLGLDGRVAIGNSREIGQFQFGVQIKARRRCQISSRGHVTIPGIKRATLLYWVSSLLPTLVVLYDATKRRGYYSWLPDALPRPKKFLSSRRKTVTLHLSAKQVLDEKCWKAIATRVEHYYEWLTASLERARSSELFLTTLNSLARAAQGLGRVQVLSPSVLEEESADIMQLQTLSMLELLSHREAYCGLVELAEILGGSHPAGEFATSGARYYKELLENSYYPLDDALRKRADTFAIRSNPKETARVLPLALGLLHDLLVGLTGGRNTPDASSSIENRLVQQSSRQANCEG